MRQTKRFAVVGSDARQAAAGRALARAGYTVGGVQQLPQADCILLPLPLEQSGLPLAQLLGMAKPGALALGGKVTDSARTIARAAGVVCGHLRIRHSNRCSHGIHPDSGHGGPGI